MKYILGLCFISWHTASTILGIFEVISVFLSADELTDGWQHLGSFRMEAGHLIICLHNEALIKTPKGLGLESLRIAAHMEVSGGWCA